MSFDKLTNIAPISKTLRFRLVPVGKTLESIEELGKLDKDIERDKFYYKLKDVADEYYRDFIRENLSNLNLDWEKLFDAYKLYDPSNKESIKNLEKSQNEYRKKILKIIIGELNKSGEKNSKDELKNSKELYNKLFKKEFILEVLPEYIKSSNKYDNEILEGLELYSKFTTRLGSYWETRKNIFTDKPIPTAVPFRTVNENFKYYFDNIVIFNKNKDYLNDKIDKLEKELIENGILEKNQTVLDFFTPNGFNYVVTQRGIDTYQAIRGGFTKESGEKIQGINEILNLTQQQLRKNSDTRNIRLGVLNKLRKQILEHSESTSFLIDQIENEEDLIDRIYKFDKIFFEDEENSVSIIKRLNKLHENISLSNEENIFIDARNINKFSHYVFGQWDVIRNAYAIKINDGSKEEQKKYKEYIQIDESSKTKRYLSIHEIQELITVLDGFENISVHNELIKKYEINKFEKFNVDDKIIGNAAKIEKIKAYLEAHINEYHKWKLLMIGDADLDTDNNFYPLLTEIISDYKIIPLFNLTRNFLTKKHSNKDKIKINFDFPTLADGWSESKVSDNRSIILRKDNKYYLGVLEDKKILKEIELKESPDYYEMMKYNLFPDAAKMIPKCSVSKKLVKGHFESGNDTSIYLEDSFMQPLEITKELYNLQNNLYDGKKKYQIDYLRNTGDEEGYLMALGEWIDFCKDFLSKYSGTQYFDYSSLKKTVSYEKLDQFYADVDACSYNVEFEKIDKNSVDNAIESGKVLLFQIYNKDFSAESKGKKNLHTLYWLSLFSEENLKHKKLKLNGQAEIFYRKALEKNPIIHREGSILLNKIDKEGKSIPESIYNECYKYLNKKITKDNLSTEAKEVINRGLLEYKEARFDIIKDRRYSEDQFFLHVPISFNWDVKTNNYVNQKVLDMVKNKEIKHVIGIDRGERHLLYYTVVDLNGNIVEQDSFNILKQDRFNMEAVYVNYKDMLQTREKERDNARKNWKNINNIKELKDGYLSHVVHKLSKLIVKYEAIVIMENLNQGFKRGRFKVERQVYQKFELALMNKLASLSFKETYENGDILRPAGILNPIQACYPVNAYQELKGQNGIVFYLPAAYTSVVDPVTGFINLFRLNWIKSSKYEDFFKLFKSIKYDRNEDDFKFEFNYKDFSKSGYLMFSNLKSKLWIVSSRGERIKYNSKKKEYYYLEPTEILKKKLSELNIDYIDVDLLTILDDLDITTKSKLLKSMYEAFRYSVQLRNHNDIKDYIVSPVSDENGIYYNSENVNIDEDKLPDNGDANGAFNIARKGVLLSERIRENSSGKVDLKIKHEDWINYIIK